MPTVAQREQNLREAFAAGYAHGTTTAATTRPRTVALP
jgi:hypothetical protein